MTPPIELLTTATAERYRSAVTSTVDRLADRFAAADRPTTDTAPEVLRARVQDVDLDAEPLGTDRALAELDELFVREAVWFHDPAYLAHLNCPVALPAVAAESVLAAVNPSVDTWDQSRIGTEIERHVVSWLAGRIGFAAGDGIFTSGGSQSNLQALLLAREALGVSGTVFTTAETHFSIAKSARLLGLEAVVAVATDHAGRMVPAALAEAIAAARAAGQTPMAVVATAGTTDRGVIDPLEPIADVCDLEGVWLHVDAAYGCGLLVSPTRRHLLDGAERARSVTADLHKAFFQPVSSSALLVQRPEDLRRTAWYADYLNPEDAAEPNQVDKSLQTTRRFDALKLWATLRATGADAIGEAFDAVIDLAAATHWIVEEHPDLVLVAPTQLSTVLFRWQPAGMTDEAADALVAPIRSALLAEGRVLIAKTVVDGRPCNKLTLLNPETTPEQMRASLEHVVATAARVRAVTAATEGANR
ncbi:pyridoxal phosphate-dependent decarboxylase family protein [Curtobacterium flaccumfaciens]|uniref:pyridoxal phosphate-dependent decarboxylase family protein n=1 Tax=Curtobacterium flaccumfaciens TaxID=2035 RepID=UPI001ADB1AC3|nr:pyridoxal-dependent decarboxylase [Curtobacterium flaccumfaciens]MBO9040828.1 aminotransferase class V-fold PLP-dependent enzyme [Curtobacterium flaccumfaciens pv. flaccumfaciens]